MASETPRLRRPTRLRIVDDVRKSLEDAILSGHMQPGERLLETPLATQLGVGRTTVREALLALERDGLVVNEPRRGAFVTRLSPADASDLRMVRALLEAFAVQLARNRFDGRLIDELSALVGKLRACQLPDDFPRLIQIDLAFHRLLVERAGSRRLLDIWSALNGQIGALMLLGVERRHATIDDVLAYHEGVLSAMRARDPDLVQRRIIDHAIGDLPQSTAVRESIVQVLETLATRDFAGSRLPPDQSPDQPDDR